MRKFVIAFPVIVLLVMVCMFICGYMVGTRHTIINAEPWVDTASNTILISFDGAVHVYEYCEN